MLTSLFYKCGPFVPVYNWIDRKSLGKTGDNSNDDRMNMMI